MQALAYVNDAVYAEDEKLNVWNVAGAAAAKVIVGAPFDTVSCVDDGPAGPYFYPKSLSVPACCISGSRPQIRCCTCREHPIF